MNSFLYYSNHLQYLGPPGASNSNMLLSNNASNNPSNSLSSSSSNSSNSSLSVLEVPEVAIGSGDQVVLLTQRQYSFYMSLGGKTGSNLKEKTVKSWLITNKAFSQDEAKMFNIYKARRPSELTNIAGASSPIDPSLAFSLARIEFNRFSSFYGRVQNNA